MNTFYALYLALNLACPYPSVVNRTDRKWEDIDYQVLYRQTLKCQQMGFAYLDTLVRKDNLAFHVMCGYKKYCLK